MTTGFKHLSMPITVQFEVTLRCNNACEFCYNFRRKISETKIQFESSTDEKKRILEELTSLGVYSVVFTGGEPFMNPSLVDLIKFSKKLGFVVHINTNGTLIDRATADVLKEIGVDGVMIALQADHPEEHDRQSNNKGSWNNSMSGIKNLLEQKVNVGINMTVTRNNYQFVNGVGKLAAMLGIPFSITRFIPINKQDADLELSYTNLKKVLKDLEEINRLFSKKPKIITPIPLCSTYYLSSSFPDARCTAGLTWCAISPNLDVRPCTFTSDVMGNLRNAKFFDIWNSEKMKRFQNLNDNPRECLECEILHFCFGGCRQLIKIHKQDPLMLGAVQLKNILFPHQEITKIELDSIFSKYPKIALRLEEFGGILISSINKFVTLKGETSIFIWKQIDGKKDVKEILYNLMGRYDVSWNEAKKDVIEFLTELYIHGLIKGVN